MSLRHGGDCSSECFLPFSKLHVALLLMFSGFASASVHAACTSPSTVPGTWTNANGNIASCVNISGVSKNGDGVVDFEGEPTNQTFTAAGDNVYNDMGTRPGFATIYVYTANSSTLDFQVSGSQTIEETGGAAFPSWTGMQVRASAAGSTAQLIIDGSMLIGGVSSGTTVQTGILLESTVRNAIAELLLNGSLDIDFPTSATNSKNVALNVFGGQATGSGSLTIGTSASQPFYGSGITANQAIAGVALTGPIHAYTTGPSLVVANGATATLDASGQSSPSQFVSLGLNPAYLSTIVVTNGASLTLNNANVQLTNAGPPSV